MLGAGVRAPANGRQSPGQVEPLARSADTRPVETLTGSDQCDLSGWLRHDLERERAHTHTHTPAVWTRTHSHTDTKT